MNFADQIKELLSFNVRNLAEHNDGPFRIFTAPARNVCCIAVPVTAKSMEEAAMQTYQLENLIHSLDKSSKRIIITEDLWNRSKECTAARLLAQFGQFRPIFARNTKAFRISKTESAAFLRNFHTYGDASARYRYGLFDKEGTLVAVASFSSARTWRKEEKTIRSYEWVRYASLPDTRVIGGMGKILKAFINDVRPDDIMSYADCEWTEGDVYERLGFIKESFRSPVAFIVDDTTWKRKPVSLDSYNESSNIDHCRYHINLGSIKYRFRIL